MMKITQMLSEIDFHDSIVTKIDYFPQENRLIIGVELCNWRQKIYKKGDPEILLGSIIFKNVSRYQMDSSFVINENEILSIELLTCQDTKECIKLVLMGDVDVVVLIIEAEDVLWDIKV
ncbi:MAG TPA: hypothetical protein VHY08_05305 [Bacillota bacterium]|nr:hypothetical protein [Bacillota bacterium]